jgi:hypothetical protein
MNALRKTRLFVLFAFVAVLAVSLTAAPANAGGCHSYSFHSSYPSYCNYGSYCYQPVVKYVVKPITYPVTQYDCYGQPYVIWKTTYQTVPTYLSY